MIDKLVHALTKRASREDSDGEDEPRDESCSPCANICVSDLTNVLKDLETRGKDIGIETWDDEVPEESLRRQSSKDTERTSRNSADLEASTGGKRHKRKLSEEETKQQQRNESH